MRWLILNLTLAMAGAGAGAQEFQFEESMDLRLADATWLRTITTPLSGQHREATYKVFTHIYDFEGTAPITKGVGGKFTHHRGLFIGWNHTMVGGKRYDTWHMTNCSQEHIAWLDLTSDAHAASQVQEVRWNDELGKTFITEFRTIRAAPGDAGIRIVDFQSKLRSTRGTIMLNGDLQHAGMQVRLANEVAEHEETTKYILPAGAEELEDDKVVDAWWVACSAEIGGKRYWIIHMTPARHPLGVPVYSIRRYARFGAFFEPILEEGKMLELNFRIVVSDKELTQEQCQALYEAYNAEIARR
jgi:hypothetical protein